MARDPISSFISVYAEALRDQSAAIFAGAGLSIPAGIVDWKELLRDIAVDVGLDVDEENDLVSVAQYHLNKRGRHKINQALVNEFAARAKSTENHRILASLPIRTFWTTNYDGLIEQAIQAAGKMPDVKIRPENLATTIPRRDAVVYKMHGDASQPDQAIVTREDYELYPRTRQLFSTALQGDLVSKTFLFVGFSFSDPNLAYVLGRIRVLLGTNVRHHYCLLRRVHQRDFSTRKAFHYARAKQDLQVEDLQRYGIIGLVVNDYADYTNVMRRVSRAYRRSRVFVSGSAADYAPWTQPKAEQLIQEIARQLAQNGFGVVSGAGVGVGPSVVNGVLEQLDRDNTRVVDDRLILRQFPQGIVDPRQRKRRWTKYRQEILNEAGIAVFLFGNKRDATGAIVDAEGVDEEFAIAVESDIAVVPVGCTGSVSATLHKRVQDRFERYYPARGYKALFASLSKKGNVASVAAKVLRVVKKLRDDA
jgi:hypothetical protein